MKAKLGAALVCLAFAIPFGGVGAFTAWMIGTMIHDASRATEWVKVRATVDAPSSYRYTFQGREYHATRLGLEPLGGTDNIDSWHDDMAGLFATAMAEKKPITVYVNPEQPGEALVDRQIRWKLVMFLGIFALAFGGVGVGALFFGARALMGKKGLDISTRGRRTRGSQEAGIGVLWVFAFFWNVISVPIAILVVPDAIANGEWAALLVLIFPLIGALILWGAIAATISAVKRKFRPEPVKPAAPSRPASDGVFARGMLDDKPAGAIDTDDVGLPPPPDPAISELERISGKKLDAVQREQLEKLSPKQRKMIAKMAGWAEKLKTD